jgi:hypothetical protein
MNKKLKVTLIFLLGWLCGALSIAIIAVYDIHRKEGSPLMEPKLYGNVKIYSCKNEDQVAHDIGLENWVIIEKNKDILLSLTFNNDKEFSGFSFHNKGDMIVSYAIPMKGEKYAAVDYGTLEQNLSWMDYNSDGIFDIQHHKNDNTKKILIDEEWVKIPESGKVVVVNGNNEIEYDFDYEKGKWLPLEDGRMIEKE